MKYHSQRLHQCTVMHGLEEAMDTQSESRFVNTMVYFKLALTQYSGMRGSLNLDSLSP